MKEKHYFFKALLPAALLSIVASFMLFIVEPITFYSGNMDDLWFDIYDTLPILFKLFGLSVLCLMLFFLIIYLCSKKIFKKEKVYYSILIVLVLVFLATYIQGNFLAGSLPGLNGDSFNWREYMPDVIISLLLWVILFGLTGFFLIKKKITFQKLAQYSSYLLSAIFIMLSISLLSTLLTTPALEDKTPSRATYDYFDLASTDRNFFVFLVDAVDSQSFHQLLQENQDYQQTFQDFTYYPDTTSYYPYTRDSIPYIFTQTPNHNEDSFGDYSRKAYSNSTTFKNLQEDNYKMLFYEDEAIFDSETADTFDNMSKNIRLNESNFIEQIVRYDLFKYLPFPLKGKAHIEKLSFWMAEIADEKLGFTWRNIDNYQYLNSHEIEKTDEKVFHFIHVEGAHIPFNLDENIEPIDSKIGTYSQKQKAAFTMIQTYINRLKTAGVYDNSSIVIMADHGYKDGVYEYDYINSRFNPILYIKGVNETHSKMHTSDKPISFEDLGQAFDDLRLGKKSTDLFKDIEYPRDRTIIYYVWNEEDHMVEEIQSGKAWDDTTITETGNVFDR